MTFFVRSVNILKTSLCIGRFPIGKPFGTAGRSQVSRKQTVSKHLVLNEAPIKIFNDTDSSEGIRSVVILYEWLGAKPTAVDKYCQFYHKRGLDVITVKGTLNQFLKPEAGFVLAREVLDYLSDRQHKENYIVHAFSVGAFNHTLCLMTANDADKYRWFSERIRGSVFDSIVIGTLENMTNGMSISISKSKVIQSAIRLLCMSYFGLRKDQTVEFYDKAVEFYRNNPVIVPTQYFYSHDDPMCDTRILEELLEYWRKKFPTMDLYVNSWNKSAHAAHIKFHEKEYKTALDNFLKQIGL